MLPINYGILNGMTKKILRYLENVQIITGMDIIMNYMLLLKAIQMRIQDIAWI